jgi:uncharacterized protein YegL
MSGRPVEELNKALQVGVSGMRRDPVLLERCHASVVTFAGRAEQLVPLTELHLFTPPPFKASGGCSLGLALKFVADCADRDLVKETDTAKGDYLPSVFIMTGGHHSDDIGPGLAAFKRRPWANVMASVPEDWDRGVLDGITDDCRLLKTIDSQSFAQYFIMRS